MHSQEYVFFFRYLGLIGYVGDNINCVMEIKLYVLPLKFTWQIISGETERRNGRRDASRAGDGQPSAEVDYAVLPPAYQG